MLPVPRSPSQTPRALPAPHAVLLHQNLCFSGQTERTVATARALEEAGYRVSIVTSSGTRTRAVEQLGFKPILAEFALDPWRNPFSAMRTRRLIKSLKPSIVHATSNSLAPLLTTIAPSLRVPWIQELHRPVASTLLSNRANFAATIVNSESLIESVVNHGGVPRSQVRTIKNAPTPFVPEKPTQPFDHSGPPRIGCSGLLDDEHATAWFLEAARLMVLSGTRAMFVVLGEGPNESAIRRFIRGNGLNEHITVAVPTTNSAAESLSALDVHVSCKLEGGPGWLACQAVVQAIPSVFVAAGDAYELVEDKSNGILIEPNDSRRLADELTLLCTQTERARAMGLRGRARFLETTSPVAFGQEIAELYESALGAAV